MAADDRSFPSYRRQNGVSPYSTRRFFQALFLVGALLAAALSPAAERTGAVDLPALGDPVSGTVSREGERRLGAAWLRELRGRSPLFYDPLVNDYAEHLAWRLASHSDLVEPRLTLVMLNSTEINAFAVPGGVMGINAGLLLAAGREDEVASVIAHELAHLSQRHYARGVDQARRQQPLTLAAFLASVLVAATVGGDAGAAAIAATQAGVVQSQLAFSREFEREADRIGMQTLSRAGFDPEAMPLFFENLQRQSPVDPDRHPEWLRTHPVNESRISDSRNRARQLPVSRREPSADFDLARLRLQVAFSRDPVVAVERYATALREAPEAAKPLLRYGLSLALLRAGRLPESLEALLPLRRESPDRIAWRVTEGEILLSMARNEEAATVLMEGLALAPDNFPLAITAARALLLAGKAERAAALLERQALLRQDDPQVWDLLSRARSESGDAVGVHAARAEYLFLLNRIDPALEQLRLGIEKAGQDFPRASPLRVRIQQIESVRNDLKL